MFYLKSDIIFAYGAVHTLSPKICCFSCYITLVNLNQFQPFFHCCIQGLTAGITNIICPLTSNLLPNCVAKLFNNTTLEQSLNSGLVLTRMPSWSFTANPQEQT